MKTWFHKIFLALIFTLTFTHAQVGVSVPNGLSSLQVSVSLFDAAQANACAWVAGTNNWSSSAAWTSCGGVAPTSADTCAISGAGTLTADGTSGSPNICGSTDFTGFTGTLTHASAKELDIYGGLTLVSGMTYVPNVASILKFKATSGTNNITTAAKRMGPTTFDGVGGTWQFQDAYNPIAVTTITLTNGALNTNGQAVGATSGVIFSSSNSNTRSLTLGATTWNLPASTAGAIWDAGVSTNMTLSAGSSTIKITTLNSTGAIFNGGGLTYGTFQIAGANNASKAIINNANTFANLNFTQTGINIATLVFGANQRVTGTLTLQAQTSGSPFERLFITSDTKGTPRTITVDTTVTAAQLDFEDIIGAGAASWNLSAITGGSGDCGGNSGITFNTPKNAYMKTAVSVNWSAANWFTASGGSTPITPTYPLPQDTAIFDANSVTTGSKIITVDAASIRLPAMNWTGVLNTPALAISTNSFYFGSITLVSGMTFSGVSSMTFEGRGLQTITTAGTVITAPITIDAITGTWTQQDDLTESRTGAPAFTLTSGTWDAGVHNTTFSGASGTIAINNGTMKGSGTLSVTGASSPSFTISGGDVNMPNGVYSMTGAGSSLVLGGGTFEIGTLTLTGRTFQLSGTAVQLGTGGAAFASTQFLPGVGTLAPTTGNKITFIGAASITVAADSGGGSSSFTFGP